VNYLDSRLREYLNKPGCPLCHLLREQDQKYLDSIFWEMVNDPELRTQLIRDGGLCADHLHLVFEERPSVLGIAILFKDLLIHHLQGELPDFGNIKCRLCIRNQEMEKKLYKTLTKHWPEWKRQWGKYTFLCRKHSRLLPPEEKTSIEIHSFSEKALHEVLKLVSSFIEKFDYQKNYLPFSEFEKESWQYLLEFFASKPLSKTPRGGKIP